MSDISTRMTGSSRIELRGGNEMFVFALLSQVGQLLFSGLCFYALWWLLIGCEKKTEQPTIDS